ncbi:MAG TPA: SDR family oxidoreductase, partial [Baekduia sp.]|nr:SDR family oxidoreductase [Baekduia sp.]
GIVGLTKCAALEYASQGIRINAICPGLTDTPMTQSEEGLEDAVALFQPVGRLAAPAEIAAAALFLFSDAASFIHGTALPVDGGYVAQ